MLKKGLLIMLSFAVCASCLGCGAASADPAQNSQPTSLATEETVPVETTEPDDGSIKFFYDDRISPEEFGGKADSVIEISQQQIDSFKVGTKELDDSVLVFDAENGVYIASGVGTATLLVDNQEVLIRVKPAPISLFMITGHSIGAGQKGNAAQSVASEPGQVYSCHKTATFQNADSAMGLGHFAEVRPEGIDAFSAGGGGTIGEGSALAWKWNQLTGEKVWVLNAAVGGSVISEWHKGQTYYTPAVTMYRAAALVLKNEVAAGHYILKNTAIIYHSAANFSYKNVEYTDEVMEFWYDSMINGFLGDLAMDITGDGETETVQAIGFLPIWSSPNKGSYPYDKPINYYIALSDVYPNCFIAGEAMRNWCTDSLLIENFPEIDYQTQSEPVTKPTTKTDTIAEDDVHYNQVTYNAAGLEIGENLYKYFRAPEPVEEIYVFKSGGTVVKDSIKLKRVGATESFVVEIYPCYRNNFKIEVSDNLELISPFTVKATAEGEGFIRIMDNDKELYKITVTVGK